MYDWRKQELLMSSEFYSYKTSGSQYLYENPYLDIRRATLDDAQTISSLITEHEFSDLLLPRSLENIRRNINNFFVADFKGDVVGCVAYKIFPGELYEIRTLVVSAECCGGGIASCLVNFIIGSIEELKADRIFTLTLRPALFERIGFKKVSKHLFPEKVWEDCSTCRKKFECEEIALVLHC